jgi:hypothetical protein
VQTALIALCLVLKAPLVLLEQTALRVLRVNLDRLELLALPVQTVTLVSVSPGWVSGTWVWRTRSMTP